MTILIPPISMPKPVGYSGKKKSRPAAEEDNEDNNEDEFPEITRASGDEVEDDGEENNHDDDDEAQAPPSRNVIGKCRVQSVGHPCSPRPTQGIKCGCSQLRWHS